MIDDDFESVFRRMIEQFMDAFSSMSEGSMRIKSWNGSNVNDLFETQIDPQNDEPVVEKIDFDDSSLILVEERNETEVPQIKLSGSRITLRYDQQGHEFDVEVGFHIDLEKSKATQRNGVLEITAVKSIDDGVSTNDGYLRIEY